MFRENYVLFWGIFFAVTAVGGSGIIICLTLIARYLRELTEIVKTKKFKIGMFQ